MRALAIIAALALSGCDAAPDGYTYEQTEFRRDDVAVSVVTYPTLRALHDAAALHGIGDMAGRELAAFSSLGETDATCTIHVVEPAVSYQPEWLGHEFLHCIRGRWHR